MPFIHAPDVCLRCMPHMRELVWVGNVATRTHVRHLSKAYTAKACIYGMHVRQIFQSRPQYASRFRLGEGGLDNDTKKVLE